MRLIVVLGLVGVCLVGCKGGEGDVNSEASPSLKASDAANIKSKPGSEKSNPVGSYKTGKAGEGDALR